MEREELMGKTEAILFAGGEPVALERIAQVLGVRTYAIEEIIDALREKYNTPHSGVHLLRLENTAQFCTNPAYIQPVTKAFVEQVRGVDCSGVIGSLMQKELLEERGRLELPGRPLLYGTTENFLRCFQLSSLEELPPPPSDQKEPEEKQETIEALF